MERQVYIESTHCGPAESGNGGYVCGLVARHIDGPAEVRLFVPPPLETPLDIQTDVGQVMLVDGGAKVAGGRNAELKLHVPPRPTMDEARAAVDGYTGFHNHPFATCFVCGPEREEGDGLRIFTGPLVGDTKQVAAPWIPAQVHADSDGIVHPEIIWAALDCAGSFTDPSPAVRVLGTLTADVSLGPVRADVEDIVFAWPISTEGRKHLAGTAICSANGQVLAKALAVWIAIG